MRIECSENTDENDKVDKKHGEHTRNDNGRKLIQLYQEHKYKMTNTFPTHKYTQKSKTKRPKISY